MKIADIRATTVAVPVRHPPWIKLWFQRTHVKRTIVEVMTDTGLVGLGETRGRYSTALINSELRDTLLGTDPLDRAGAIARCVDPVDDFGFPEDNVRRVALGGIEVALWDIAGKHAGEPLYELLGGKVRAKALFAGHGYPIDPVNGLSSREIPDAFARRAREIVAEQNAEWFEFKIARHDMDTDIATILATREALGPSVRIAVDANMAYTVEQAARMFRAVAPARLDNFEEPVPGLADLAALRRAHDVPVSTHCTLVDAVRPYPAIDAVASDPPLHGGIQGTLDLMRGVAAAGRGFWLRSTWELGIAWAVHCHLGIARPEMTRPSQGLIDLVEDDLVLGPTWDVREGGVVPPATPGLGVELDRDALRAFAVA